MLQSYLCVTQDGLHVVVKEMHPCFENLIIIDAPSLQVFFMDIHQDTSLRSILEDDSISFTSRTRMCFCLGKGSGLWLVVRPSICSFHIAHFTFTSTLHFHLNLIHLLASSFLTCDVDMGWTHLART